MSVVPEKRKLDSLEDSLVVIEKRIKLQTSSSSHVDEKDGNEFIEPLLRPNPNRFVLFPIQYEAVWNMYKKHESTFWTAGEIDLKGDMDHWNNRLNDNERHFIKWVLAFFAASDGIVMENLAERFLNEIQVAEVRSFYSFQLMMENIHSETYSMMLQTFVTDQEERLKLFQAMTTIPAIAAKAEWALKWIKSKEATFAERLIAFVAVEGIFFSGSFCALFWLRERGLMPGLCLSNDLISRDENLHCVAAGTMISTEFDAVPVETLGQNNGYRVQSFTEDQGGSGISLQMQTAFTPSGNKPCVELTMEDGRTVVCTPDHQIFTSRGYIRADQLILESDILHVSEPPSSFIPTQSDQQKEAVWSHGNFSMNSPAARERSQAFGRVLGYIMSDGTLTQGTFSKICTICMGHKQDVESIQRDIHISFGVRAKEYLDNGVPKLQLPCWVAKMLADLGVLVGARINSDHFIPEFVMNAPRAFKRAFLMGLFGGDGESPSSTLTSTSVAIRASIGYSLSKVETKRVAGQRCQAEIIQLLSEFGVIAQIDAIHKYKADKERHHFSIKNDQLLSFAAAIGFAHCCHKQARLGVVAAILKMRKCNVEMNRTIGARIEELQGRLSVRATGTSLGLAGSKLAAYVRQNIKMTFDNAYSKAVEEWKSNHAVIGDILAKDDMRISINRNTSSKKWNTWAILQRFGVAKFWRADENQHRTPSESRKVTPTTYAIPHGMNTTPTMRMKVVRRVNVGNRDVFDITVDKTHNFLANGVVVHNCEYAILLYSLLQKPLGVARVHEILSEAVAIEKSFILDALPCKLLGMNSDQMSQYIEYVTDRLLQQMKLPKIWNSVCPFDFMMKMTLRARTNFFESRESSYAMPSEHNALIVDSNSYAVKR